MTGPAVVSGNLLTDNPELYEYQFPDPEHRAARFVADLVTRHGPTGRVLLDLGCGTGRDAGQLARTGYTVTGLDASAEMIRYARAHHPRVRFLHADMRSFELPERFDVITCLDSTLLYCHRTADLTALLDRCRCHLVPGGLLVAEMRNGAFFLGNTELLNAPTSRTVTWRGVTYASRTQLWIDHAAQLLRRERVWTWPGCSEPLIQRSAWRLLFPQELAHLLDAAGFDTLALFDAPGPRTDPPWSPSTPPSTALSGDRLHVVARRR